MSYASRDAMIRFFGEGKLAQMSSAQPGGSINEDVLLQAMDSADRLIDGYLSQRYTLPLVGRSFPERHACDISFYYLGGDRVYESGLKRYEQAVAFLRDVARGLADLPEDGSAPPAAEKSGDDVVVTATRPPVFSPDTLSDY